MVELVKFGSAWISVLLIAVFFLILVVGFMPWKEPFGFLTKGNWFAWVVLVAIILVFLFSAGYVFNWAITWSRVTGWFDTEWFGFVLLLVIAGIVAAVISRK